MRTGIALGSNLGDRLKNLQEATSYLASLSLPGQPFLVSHAIETNPVDCPPDSPVFLNAAVEIEFKGDIFDLLRKLQAYEQSRGRPSLHAKNAPRTIDLDILYCDNMTLKDPVLILPHPQLATRSFVLIPLAEISPQKIIPGQSKSILELKGKISNNLDKYISYNII
ncbi:MAG: 2-amino-4-hydroxy-6-hydroxymethyldihydropteridine diphosphokinase [Chthoniobacterales bacterium]